MTSPAASPDRPAAPQFLRSVGIDAEQVARFDKFASGEKPWRLVYSPREAEHLAAQPRVALAFCAAFCCKEAFYKALGEHFAFPELECFYRPDALEQEILPSPALVERLGSARVFIRFDGRFVQDRGEFLVEVHLARGPALRGGEVVRAQRIGTAAGDREDACLDSLAVADVEADRRRIEEEHFSPAEVAELGGRRAQSVAGFLALKRALAGLWAGAGVVARPRDFEVGHHGNGAPRLAAAPGGAAVGEVLISISHTRRWAYGLAALGKHLDELLY